MKIINKNQLISVVGGLPLAILHCQTGRITAPKNLSTDSNAMKGFAAVSQSGDGGVALDNGFNGVTIGVLAGPYFISLDPDNIVPCDDYPGQ